MQHFAKPATPRWRLRTGELGCRACNRAALDAHSATLPGDPQAGLRRQNDDTRSARIVAAPVSAREAGGDSNVGADMRDASVRRELATATRC